MSRVIPIMLLAVISSSAMATPLAEYSAPMPKFATQPSATLIYCKGTLGQSLQVIIDGTTYPKVHGVIDNASSTRLRLNFTSSEIIVSNSSIVDGTLIPFSAGFPYKILNDDPIHFFAIQDRSKTMDMLQTIAIDRVAGTLIWTTLSASFPNIPGNPYTTSSFFVCNPTDD